MLFFRFGCALFVTIATRHVDLRCVSFLNHGKDQLLHLKYNGERFLYQSTTVAKTYLKTQKIAKFCYSLGYELFVAMVTRYKNCKLFYV